MSHILPHSAEFEIAITHSVKIVEFTKQEYGIYLYILRVFDQDVLDCRSNKGAIKDMIAFNIAFHFDLRGH